MNWRARLVAPVLLLSTTALFISAALTVLPMLRDGTVTAETPVIQILNRTEVWLLGFMCLVSAGALGLMRRTTDALVRRLRMLPIDVRRITRGKAPLGEAEPEQLDEIERVAVRLNWYASSIRQVTDEKTKMERMAETDPLTGLPNRRGLLNFLNKVIGHDRGWIDPMQVGVMHLDLDHFKTINDTLGHEAGDQVLREAARRMEATVRDTDLIARLGGDEFVIVMPGIEGKEVLARLAERLIEQFEIPIILGEEVCRVGLSVGVVLGPHRQSLTDPHKLLMHADLALTHAKLSGRGRYAVFSQQIAQAYQKDRDLAAEIRKGLLRDAFEPGFAPVLDLGTNAVTAVAVSSCWNREESGLQGPDTFMKAAEIENMAEEICLQVLEKTCETLRTWHAEGIDVPILQFSMTRAQLIAPGVIDKLSWILDDANIEPSCLAIEVGERICSSRSFQLALANLRRLQDLGIHVVLAEFGANGASMRNVLNIAPLRLKAEWSTPGAETDARAPAVDLNMLRQMPALSRALGIQIIASGLDSAEDIAAARAAGYPEGQGDALARVLSAGEAGPWLQANLGRGTGAQPIRALP